MLLIIGKGESYNYLNQIQLIDSTEALFRFYGRSSKLSLTCERAFELGQEKLYVCNIQSDSDYFEIIDQIRSMAPDYILAPNLRSDNKIKLKDGRIMPISLVMSELLPDRFFILTDYHAREFKDHSHFLSHYNKFKLDLNNLAKHKNNIALVANCLKDSDEASVDVACSLITAQVGDYPRLTCGETLFALEYEDFRTPIIYFKNEIALNLFNLNKGIESNLIVQRMIQVLKQEITADLDYLIGTRFTKNTLFTVKNRVEKILSKRQNHYYKKYRLVDIVIINKEIHIEIDVYPFLAIDAVKTSVTIRGI